MTDYLEDLSQFMDEWNERAQREEVQYTTALMRQMLHLFAKWLNAKEERLEDEAMKKVLADPFWTPRQKGQIVEAVANLKADGLNYAMAVENVGYVCVDGSVMSER